MALPSLCFVGKYMIESLLVGVTVSTTHLIFGRERMNETVHVEVVTKSVFISAQIYLLDQCLGIAPVNH